MNVKVVATFYFIYSYYLNHFRFLLEKIYDVCIWQYDEMRYCAIGYECCFDVWLVYLTAYSYVGLGRLCVFSEFHVIIKIYFYFYLSKAYLPLGEISHLQLICSSLTNCANSVVYFTKRSTKLESWSTLEVIFFFVGNSNCLD